MPAIACSMAVTLWNVFVFQAKKGLAQKRSTCWLRRHFMVVQGVSRTDYYDS